MKTSFLLSVYFSLLVFVSCYGGNVYDPLETLMKLQRSKKSGSVHATTQELTNEHSYEPVYVGPQDGLKNDDKIVALPGQPDGTDFDQYSGYVKIRPGIDTELFYYLAESPIAPSTKPLVLWLNGGPGCSSLGSGAMMELGPFRVNADNKTLSRNKYAWNEVANVLFLESPLGVGFSFIIRGGYVLDDVQTAKDSYAFLINWLERFPEYKTRDFYIAGESYAGYYVPQLAQLILQNNKITNQTVINLKGIALGNAYVDFETEYTGLFDFFWTHAIISDEIHEGIVSNCDFSEGGNITIECYNFIDEANGAISNIYLYDIYAPLCSKYSNSTPSISDFDPCSGIYIAEYLNTLAVTQSLHAKPILWQECNEYIDDNWQNMPFTVLPVIKELMSSGISVWMYSGDTDGRVPVTVSQYSIDKLKTTVKTPWYPWMYEGEAGGYVVGYENLTFVTIRGAGHFVPSYQPARALAIFTSFLEGKLP